MAYLRLSALTVLLLRAIAALAQAETPLNQVPEGEFQLPSNIAVGISTTFPQSEVFGVKLVNGQSTHAQITFHNNEPGPVGVAVVTGSLSAPDPLTNGETSKIVRNLTAVRFQLTIPPGGSDALTYSFATELHPQDLRLNLLAMITTEFGAVYTVNAFNETVSVVEPDASFFDPQLIFLYLVLSAVFLGTCYFVYNTWVSTFFPQKSRGKGGKRSGASKKTDPADQATVVGADGPAIATGKDYDESWIPEHHINRPEAKRVKSGASAARPKSRGKPE